MRQAVLFVGHGTRDVVGIEEFRELAGAVERRVCDRLAAAGGPAPWFTISFLELSQPDIAAGLAACVQTGATRVLVVPFFLWDAGHVKRDIPDAVAAFVERHPGVAVDMLPAVGVDSVFVDVTADRVREAVEAIAERGLAALGQPVVLLVGRGNRDLDAQRDFAQAAKQLARRLEHVGGVPVAGLDIAYLAAARPSLEESLTVLAGRGVRLVCIAPYLWFEGYLTRVDLPRRLLAWTAAHADVRLVCARRLGPDARLADRMAERVVAGLRHPDSGEPARLSHSTPAREHLG
ncbi:MAG: sirohydrochlorin chelatase [Alicyclobacillaceae bacterium]|nr:sirohydrochlorin chelatase [Alicyclobacillaceae bacterium]